MIIDETMLTQLILAIIAFITAITAVIQNRQKTTAIAALTSGTPQSLTPAIVASLPERSWKMSDSTKRFITFDATEENLKLILAQVDAAEAQHLTQYRIDFAGGYYLIEFGLQYGGSGNPSGK